MMQVFQKFPPHLTALDEAGLSELIRTHKRTLGERCVILGHHYQRDEVIAHADVIGDSLKLAQHAKTLKSTPWVVFCGVHFMAETADILTGPEQKVSLPDPYAGCHLADMAHIADVQEAYRSLAHEGIGSVVPLTYINSTAAIKALVGREGGSICTSSNAQQMITWALERGRHLFFFPDQHLGRNVCKSLGLDPQEDMLLWNPKKHLGGHSPEELKRRKVWLWEGHCPVHAQFTVKQIQNLRQNRPETKVISHPECPMEVIDQSDLFGSTDFIIRTIASSPPRSSWAVATEMHLVHRLARQFPEHQITSLNPFACVCSTMNRIRAISLAWVLDDLVAGKELRGKVTVAPEMAAEARIALDKMFEVTLPL